MEKDITPQTYPAQTIDPNNLGLQDTFANPVDMFQVKGFIETVTTIPTHVPNKFEQQIKLYVDSITSPTTQILYVYSNKTNTWLSFAASTISFTDLFSTNYWLFQQAYTNYEDGGSASVAFTGNGYITGTGSGWQIGAGAGSIGTARWNKYLQTLVGWNKSSAFRVMVTTGGATSNSKQHLYFCNNQDTSSATQYYGFRIEGTSSGTEIIKAVTKDGTTELATDVSSLVTPNWDDAKTHVLTAVLTAGVSVKFYIDATLVATHTTNIPLSSNTTDEQHLAYKCLNTPSSDDAYLIITFDIIKRSF